MNLTHPFASPLERKEFLIKVLKDLSELEDGWKGDNQDEPIPYNKKPSKETIEFVSNFLLSRMDYFRDGWHLPHITPVEEGGLDLTWLNGLLMRIHNSESFEDGSFIDSTTLLFFYRSDPEIYHKYSTNTSKITDDILDRFFYYLHKYPPQSPKICNS